MPPITKEEHQRDRKLWRFHGGIQLPARKEISLTLPLLTAAVPRRLTLPLSQHVGTPAEPVVKPGDTVLKGQLIAHAREYLSASIHAPTSGTVVAIEKRPVPHPSGLSAECIIIDTDGKERWRWRKERIEDYTKLDPSELRNRLREAGIVGLGGAGFPTFVKVNPGSRHKIDLLILNGAECEPYISCDEMLMRINPWEVVGGLQILRHAVRAEQCIIAIEDNMPQAIAAMEIAVAGLNDPDIQLVKVPAIYPTGGEKQLIQLLTGLEVPAGGLPADIGIVCQNVATAAAACRAVTEQEPLVSRIVTITGKGVRQPRNVLTLLGTPMAELIEQCGGYTEDAYRLLMGGPLMGVALRSDQLPVVKTTNCLLVATEEDVPRRKQALPCIRCGRCAEVCPINLLPQQLYWHAHTRDLDRVSDYNLFDCIECGCCSHVCPSHIPLVHYFRFAKSEIWSREIAREQSERAGRRHEFRAERLERDKQERAERLKQKKKALQEKSGDSAKKAVIAAALERAEARKQAAAQTGPDHEQATTETDPD